MLYVFMGNDFPYQSKHEPDTSHIQCDHRSKLELFVSIKSRYLFCLLTGNIGGGFI